MFVVDASIFGTVTPGAITLGTVISGIVTTGVLTLGVLTLGVLTLGSVTGGGLARTVSRAGGGRRSGHGRGMSAGLSVKASGGASRRSPGGPYLPAAVRARARRQRRPGGRLHELRDGDRRARCALALIDDRV